MLFVFFKKKIYILVFFYTNPSYADIDSNKLRLLSLVY